MIKKFNQTVSIFSKGITPSDKIYLKEAHHVKARKKMKNKVTCVYLNI